jgi:hypothetical protein
MIVSKILLGSHIEDMVQSNAVNFIRLSSNIRHPNQTRSMHIAPHDGSAHTPCLELVEWPIGRQPGNARVLVIA